LAFLTEPFQLAFLAKRTHWALPSRRYQWACPARPPWAFLAELFREVLLAKHCQRWGFLGLRIQQTFLTERAVNIQAALHVLFGSNPTAELDYSSR
jgi:hypothetical protein